VDANSSNGSVNWDSSDTTVVSVSADGLLVAQGAGTAAIIILGFMIQSIEASAVIKPATGRGPARLPAPIMCRCGNMRIIPSAPLILVLSTMMQGLMKYLRLNDPLTYTEQNTYTITWTYDDGHWNTAKQEQTLIFIGPWEIGAGMQYSMVSFGTSFDDQEFVWNIV